MSTEDDTGHSQRRGRPVHHGIEREGVVSSCDGAGTSHASVLNLRSGEGPRP
jgi:hypothetical protein